MKIQTFNLQFILLLLIIWVLFFIKGVISIDPDFGWHIRMGELILAKGIPTTDPFSYTMPSFPFVDHEWFTDIVLFKLYNNVGSIGLSAIFATIALITLVLLIPKKLVALTVAPLLLSAVVLLPFSGTRPQVLTWLMLALLIRSLLNPLLWKKVRLFIPIFFILWANIHGGFAIGIIVLFLVILLKAFGNKKVDFGDLLVLILSVVGTLINPYGVRIWGEISRSAFDSSLRFSIVEWAPIIFRFDLAYLFLATISSILLIRFKTKFSLIEKILFLVLLLLGVSSQRNIPFWIIIAIPIFTKEIFLLSEEVKKIKRGEERFKKVYRGFLIFSSIIVIFQTFLSLYSVKFLNETEFYPQKAITYLKNQSFKGELVAPYDWGGYLIWKLPEKKVFIDGRMPSWRYDAPKKESNYIYKDYINMVGGKMDFNNIASKYNIQKVLWFRPEQAKANSFTKFVSSLGIPLLNQMFVPVPIEDTFFIQKLKTSGWKEIYQDNVAIILVKF